ncbi:hypothetical protein EXE43_11260, partial [Halorubrum sp. SS5]
MEHLTATRRRLLAAGLVGGVGAVAGCLGTDDGADRSGGVGPELGLSLSQIDGPLRDRYVRDRDAPADAWDEAALDAVLAGERYTTR